MDSHAAVLREALAEGRSWWPTCSNTGSPGAAPTCYRAVLPGYSACPWHAHLSRDRRDDPTVEHGVRQGVPSLAQRDVVCAFVRCAGVFAQQQCAVLLQVPCGAVSETALCRIHAFVSNPTTEEAQAPSKTVGSHMRVVQDAAALPSAVADAARGIGGVACWAGFPVLSEQYLRPQRPSMRQVGGLTAMLSSSVPSAVARALGRLHHLSAGATGAAEVAWRAWRPAVTALCECLGILLPGHAVAQAAVRRANTACGGAVVKVLRRAAVGGCGAAAMVEEIVLRGGAHPVECYLATALSMAGYTRPHGLVQDDELGRVLNNKRLFALIGQRQRMACVPLTLFSLEQVLLASQPNDVWFRKHPVGSESDGVVVMRCTGDDGGAKLAVEVGCGKGESAAHRSVGSADAGGDDEVKLREHDAIQSMPPVLQGWDADECPPTVPFVRSAFVYQRGVQDLLLWPDGCKFDCRIHVLWWRDGSVLVHRRALLRVSSQRYDRGSLERAVQITNVACSGRRVPSTEYRRWPKLWTGVVALVAELAAAFQSLVTPGRYVLAGVDVVFDSTGRPWLLEVNHSPNMRPHEYPRVCCCLWRTHVCPYKVCLRDLDRLIRTGRRGGWAIVSAPP